MYISILLTNMNSLSSINNLKVNGNSHTAWIDLPQWIIRYF